MFYSDLKANQNLLDKSEKDLYNELVQLEKEGKIKKPDHELNDEEKFEYYKSIELELSKKRKRFVFNKNYSAILQNLFFFSGFVLLILIVALIPEKGARVYIPLWFAPWYVWVIDIASLIISFICFKKYSFKYIFDIDKNRLSKEISFFSYSKICDITGFDRIKLLGVSTEFLRQRDKNTGEKQYSSIYKIIVFYGLDNKQVVIESGYNFMVNDNNDFQCQINYINSKVSAVAEFIGCEYIPFDASSKIELKNGSPDSSIQSLIMLIPRENQCSKELEEKETTFNLFIVLIFMFIAVLIGVISLVIMFN